MKVFENIKQKNIRNAFVNAYVNTIIELRNKVYIKGAFNIANGCE